MNYKHTLLAGLTLAATSSALSAQADYTLQILHASDLEGGGEAITRAPIFAAIMDSLENSGATDGTVILSAGDNYIPGPFFSVASDPNLKAPLQAAYESLYGLTPGTLSGISQSGGKIDIAIMNIIGFDASAIGNHEFDLGTATFESIINADIAGPALADVAHFGAQFPYLSANLDFSSDTSLSPIFNSSILANSAFETTPADVLAGTPASSSIAEATIIDANGEPVGVIGATTQRVEIISSPGGVNVEGGVSDNDIALLATQLQPVVDAVALGLDGISGTADDVNKVILVTHLQQLSLERTLAGLLDGVDVIIAGGSDTLLSDGVGDVLRSGDTPADTYPVIEYDVNGDPVLIVSTDGEYSYVGRLVVSFDTNGVLFDANSDSVLDGNDIDATLSGVFATDEAGVTTVTGEASAANAIAASAKASLVKDLTDAIATEVAAIDGIVYGFTAYGLNGERSSVRTEETNLGNLTADANLWYVQQFIDSTAVVSIKNGGGIRASIGAIDGLTGELVKPAANPVAGKLAGGISQLDLENSLRFNNSLSLLDLSAQDLFDVMEYGFAASISGSTQGRFPQIGGLQVSYFPPTASTPVSIESLALIDENGDVTEVIYQDGAFQVDPAKEYRIVTLGFLAGGGDGYPFDTLGTNLNATAVGEQTAFAEFLSAKFGTQENAYSAPDFAITQDARIQNLDFRPDSVGADIPTEPAGAMRLTPVATYETGFFDESAAEIVAFDANTQRLFTVSSATNDVLVLDATDPENGITLVASIAAPAANWNPNSVDTYSDPVRGDVVAVAWMDDVDGDIDPTVERGIVTLYDPATLAQIGSEITVGYHPDMLKFSPDGKKLVVANEGEPRFDGDDNIVDNPDGSISIIDLSAGYTAPQVFEADFSRWDRRERMLRARGIFFTQLDAGFAASVSQDLEPEAIAITSDSRYAWVSCQENNAAALVDLRRNVVRNILPFGLVDYRRNKIDASDRDGGINIDNEPIFGMRQPDTIAIMRYRGRDFLFTANEGDARDFEESRVKGVDPADFDPAGVISVLPNLQDDEELGRLEFNTVASDLDKDGDIDQILSYGGRSMSIFQAPPVGRFRFVADTDADLDMYTASRYGTVFNSTHDDNDSFEGRSDAKGGEPEALTLGTINGKTYAFLGLERQSSIFVYDVTLPMRPQFETIASNRTFVDETGAFLDADDPRSGDLGPESIEFIPADKSPLGVPMIAVSNEVSGTITLWRIDFGS